MIIVGRKYGQLGNRLLLFAHLIAFAEEYGVPVANPAFDEYADYFRATSEDLFCRYPAKKSLAKPFPKLRFFTYKSCALIRKIVRRTTQFKTKGESLAVITRGWYERYELRQQEFVRWTTQRKPTILDGFVFRDQELLQTHAHAIRSYFTPIERHQQQIRALVDQARSTRDLLVGVHIRQGDYQQFMDGKHFFEVGQYARLMEHVQRLFPEQRVGFLVCSDAKLSPADFPELPVTLGTGHLVEDLYALSHCDYLIGTRSTFSGWASFMGDIPWYMVDSPETKPTKEEFLRFRSDYI